MAILQESQTEIQGGFTKGIESSAMSLMMDILQRFQYQFPIKSTIRELVSNGLDSITEKQTAFAILRDGKPVSDYFEDLEGDIYADSKFTAEYYDLQYLSTSKNNVEVTYHQGDETSKDYVTVSDYGVGLGGKRLAKYFSLGFSTKRLSKLPLGKFGIGAKAPLSVNSYYTIESRYNGLLYRFNVYNSKVESLIPKFDLASGRENVSVEFETGAIYAEVTDLPNGVTVTMESKKHHLQEYKDAVEKQLMYFEGVDFYIEADEVKTPQKFRPEILYEDEFLVLSNNRYYNRPHILLNRVNYGYINFDELELEHMLGNVGIKMQPEDVEVSPSRESLVWSEKTKEMVLKRFSDAAQSASVLIKKELTQPDFIDWLRACNAVRNRWSNADDIVSRLANIVDMSKVKLPYSQDTTVQYEEDLIRRDNGHVDLKLVRLLDVKKANKSATKVERDLLSISNLPTNCPIFLKTGRASNRQDRYLLTQHKNFVIIDVSENIVTSVAARIQDNDPLSDYTHYQKIYYYLSKSTHVLDYNSVEVPESFKGTEEEEELVDLESLSKEELADVNLTAEERRKLTGSTVMFTPRLKPERKGNTDRFYEWQKIELPVSEIDQWDDEEIYYGNDVDAEKLEFVAHLTRCKHAEGRSIYASDTYRDCFCSKGEDVSFGVNDSSDVFSQHRVDPRILEDIKKRTESMALNEIERKHYEDHYAYRDIVVPQANNQIVHRCTHFFFPDSGIKIIKVAQNNVKYYRDFKHINKFFLRMNGKTLTMSNRLVQWNTARKIQERLGEVAFLFNFPIDTPQGKLYRELVQYVYTYYNEPNKFVNGNAAGDLVKHLDKVAQFQLVVRSGASPEEVAQVAKEMWNSPQVEDGYALDMDLIDKFNELLDWARPVKDLLNGVENLTGYDEVYSDHDKFRTRREKVLPLSLEQAVLDYCRNKQVI